MSNFRNKKIKYPDEFVEGMDKYVERLPIEEEKRRRLSQFLHKSSGRLLDIETAGNLITSWLKENVPEKNDAIRDQTLDAVREARKLSKRIREKRIISNTKKLYSYDENKGNVSKAVSILSFSHEIIEYADSFSKKEYFGSVRERYKDDLKQTPASIIRSFSKSEGILRGHLEMARTVKTMKKAGRAVIYDPLLSLLAKDNTKFKDQFLLNLHSFIREGGHLDLIIETDCSIGPIEQLIFFMPIILSDDATVFFHSGVKNHDKVPFFIDMDRIFGYGLYSENEMDSGRGNIVLKKMVLSKVEQHYQNILKASTAVGRTYLPDRRNEFIDFLRESDIFSADATRYKTALPLFTMHEKMLKRILDDNGVTDENADFILNYRKLQKKIFEKASEEHSIHIFIPDIESEAEDKLYPIDLAGILYPAPLYYSREDFMKHLRWTVDFADENPNFQIHISKENYFSNIEATLIGTSSLIITKPRDPAVHLIINIKQ
jgi:hypothetical protein